jgi:hypothetical protein
MIEFITMHGVDLNLHNLSQPDTIPKLFKLFAKGDLGMIFLSDTTGEIYRLDVLKIRKYGINKLLDQEKLTGVEGYIESTDCVRHFMSSNPAEMSIQ